MPGRTVDKQGLLAGLYNDTIGKARAVVLPVLLNADLSPIDVPQDESTAQDGTKSINIPVELPLSAGHLLLAAAVCGLLIFSTTRRRFTSKMPKLGYRHTGRGKWIHHPFYTKRPRRRR